MSTTFLFLCITFCSLCIFIHIFMYILCFLYFYSFQPLLFHSAEFQILMKNTCFRRFFNCLSSSGDLARLREASFSVTHNPVELKLPSLRQTPKTERRNIFWNLHPSYNLRKLHPFHTPKHAACGSIDNP